MPIYYFHYDFNYKLFEHKNKIAIILHFFLS